MVTQTITIIKELLEYIKPSAREAITSEGRCYF
jgi:hypothetical protein